MAEVVFKTREGDVVIAVASVVCDPPDANTAPTLLDAARVARLPLGQSCRGEGVCRSCAVEVLAGTAALGPPGALEQRRRDLDGRRLACQATLPAATSLAQIVVAHPAWGRSAT